MSLAYRDQRLLTEAIGYLELQKFTQANDELDKITSIVRDRPEVLKVRLRIYQGLKQWDLMQAIARGQVEREPDDAQWWLAWALATRHAQSVQVARPILLTAIEKHPDVWRLHYDLACCESQLGELASAKEHITRAFVIEESCSKGAMEDEDLKPLWDSMNTRLW